ncbi:PREDICTED: uncharacterized protein LOC109229761 [Nicotiana attenuata]|uniref:uncharacterized protein LOC109229761 n=1 Tax=Nicotiana attenuata TaxID=49451 RepID=UPI0009053E4F|nr:PREDICTED: uncharacterized protein LOC109229761 [Nicotiana attenuata]
MFHLITVPLSKEQDHATKTRAGNTVLLMNKEQKQATSKESTWANVLTGNRSAANGMTLTYITLEIVEGNLVAKLEKSEIEQENLKWKNALIVYVLGEKPGYNSMKRYINQVWNIVAMPDLFYHDEGYYLVRFQTLEDMKEIMCAGPYTMNGRPMIMKHWSPYFDFAAEFLTDIPLWVKFPKLPMNCWSGNSLSKIASTIGIPMFADECTAKQTRISYARILIEVNVTKPFSEVLNFSLCNCFPIDFVLNC